MPWMKQGNARTEALPFNGFVRQALRRSSRKRLKHEMAKVERARRIEAVKASRAAIGKFPQQPPAPWGNCFSPITQRGLSRRSNFGR